MIVQCDKCKTKFRISDEKVRPTGVKVRCSRCAHVFVVRREAEPEPAFDRNAEKTRPLDPKAVAAFAARGAAENPLDYPAGVPTIPHSSLDGSQLPGLPTARAPVPAAATASSLEAAAALGFSGLPSAPKPPLPPLDIPIDSPFAPASEAKTEQTPMPPAAPSTAPDGMSPFGAPPSGPPGPPPSATDPFANLPAFDGLAETAASRPPPLPPDPFGTGAPPPLPGPDPFANPPEEKPKSGELPSFPPMGKPEASDRFPAPEFGDTGFMTEMNLGVDDTNMDPKASGHFPPPPAVTGASDIPGLLSNDLPADDDPFAGVDIDEAQPNSAGLYSDFNAGGDDVGPPSSPFPGEPNPVGSTGEALARIDLGRAGLPNLSEATHHEPTAVARAYEPGAVRAKTAAGPGPANDVGSGSWPTFVGIAVGLALAYLYVPGVGDFVGRMLGMSGPPPLTSSADPLVPGSLDAVSSQDSFVRSYPTADGHRVLVVGGDAHATEAVGAVEAVVVVLDGDRVVERRTAPVGVVIDESTLHNAKQEDDVKGAYASGAPARLAEGRAEPFMVVFWTLPQNAEERSYRIAFVKAGAPARAEAEVK